MASAEYHREWRHANPERVIAARQKYEAAHPNYRQESLDRDPRRIERKKETDSQWAKANRDRVNVSQAKSAKKRYAFLNSYKLDQGCIDCGYNESPYALEFDHRNPEEKEFGIGSNPRTTMERLLVEIAKCDVRCANCHAIRTHKEGHGKRQR